MQRSAFALLRLRSLSAAPASASATARSSLVATSSELSGKRLFSALNSKYCSKVDAEAEKAAPEGGEEEKKGEEFFRLILDNVRTKIHGWEVAQELQKLCKVDGEIVFPKVLEASKNVGGFITKTSDLENFNKRGQKLEILIGSLVLKSKVDSLDAMALLGCLKSLLRLGLNGKAFVVQSLENELTWRARSMPIKDLMVLLNFCLKRSKNSHEPGKVVDTLQEEVVRTIQRRWVEIDDAKSLVNMMHLYPEVFTETFVTRLEDRAIDKAETMSGEELMAILKVLAIKKRRTVPLLKSIGYHLNRHISKLSPKSLSEGLFALRQLSYKNFEILEEFGDAACQKLDSNTDKAIFWSLLTSMGQLLFCHRGLLNRITDLLLEQTDSLESKDLLAFLLTTAALNYSPSNSEGLYELIEERLTKGSLEGERSDVIWLDVVWSLAVLGRAKLHHYESVLSTEFYNKLLYSHDHRNVGVILKLLNVNAAASFCTPGYKGPTIDVASDPLLKDVQRGEKEKSLHVKSVMEAFNALATEPNYLLTNVNTHMGFLVHGVCIFNKSCKPVALEGMKLFSNTPDSDLPADAKRVALMVIDYNNCLLGGSELSGLSHLSKKLLEARGFKVLLAKNSEVKPNMKNLEKIKILEQNLKLLLNIKHQ